MYHYNCVINANINPHFKMKPSWIRFSHPWLALLQIPIAGQLAKIEADGAVSLYGHLVNPDGQTQLSVARALTFNYSSNLALRFEGMSAKHVSYIVLSAIKRQVAHHKCKGEIGLPNHRDEV